MAMTGADPFAIMKAMGHTDIKATLIHISPGKSYIREQGECQYGCDDTSLEPDSDILAIRNNLVLVTPISMDPKSRVNLKSFLKGEELGSGS